jgi:GntP family gluconate:H+ symporter
MYLMLLLCLAVAFIVLSTTKRGLHPFLALVAAAMGFGLAAGMNGGDLVKAVNEGFGATVGNVGLVILLGVLIGTFLDRTGAARVMANVVLRQTGARRTGYAMGLTGWVVSIPVFADSGFLLLHPLGKALAARSGLSARVLTIALALGLMASHTMVPPTPGPVAAAGILEADLGKVLLFGIPVSLLAWIPAYLVTRRLAIGAEAASAPFPEAPPLPAAPSVAAPAAFVSFLPVLLPILLILLKSASETAGVPSDGWLYDGLQFVGTPLVALLAGLATACCIPKRLTREMLSADGWAGTAFRDAALVLLVTGAGGVFGTVLQRAGMAAVLSDLLADTRSLGIWVPFLVAAALKTAQGSSTVAIITTASMLAPALPVLGLDSEAGRALGVLAIGAGSLVVSHVNDSFFWVVTQLSGMSVSQGYRLVALGTGITGVSAALLLSLLAAWTG